MLYPCHQFHHRSEARAGPKYSKCVSNCFLRSTCSIVLSISVHSKFMNRIRKKKLSFRLSPAFAIKGMQNCITQIACTTWDGMVWYGMAGHGRPADRATSQPYAIIPAGHWCVLCTVFGGPSAFNQYMIFVVCTRLECLLKLLHTYSCSSGLLYSFMILVLFFFFYSSKYNAVYCAIYYSNMCSLSRFIFVYHILCIVSSCTYKRREEHIVHINRMEHTRWSTLKELHLRSVCPYYMCIRLRALHYPSI